MRLRFLIWLAACALIATPASAGQTFEWGKYGRTATALAPAGMCVLDRYVSNRHWIYSTGMHEAYARSGRHPGWRLIGVLFDCDVLDSKEDVPEREPPRTVTIWVFPVEPWDPATADDLQRAVAELSSPAWMVRPLSLAQLAWRARLASLVVDVGVVETIPLGLMSLAANVPTRVEVRAANYLRTNVWLSTRTAVVVDDLLLLVEGEQDIGLNPATALAEHEVFLRNLLRLEPRRSALDHPR